jgi:hypothetical protein
MNCLFTLSSVYWVDINLIMQAEKDDIIVL